MTLTSAGFLMSHLSRVATIKPLPIMKQANDVAEWAMRKSQSVSAKVATWAVIEPALRELSLARSTSSRDQTQPSPKIRQT